MIYKYSPKNDSCKENTPLRLNYFAPLREQKNPPRRTRNTAGQAATEGRRKERNPFAALRLCAFA